LPRDKKDDENVKRMADLLRQGAALTELACPACSSPLFRLKDGTLWCATDEKRVLIAREGADEARLSSFITLDRTEAMLMEKVQEIQEKMQKTSDATELQKLGTALSGLLDNIEKIRKTKKA
jgi:UPF0148 protein